MPDNQRPYGAAFFPPRATRSTRFWRTCLPYQLFRFLAINLEMIRIISKGH